MKPSQAPTTPFGLSDSTRNQPILYALVTAVMVVFGFLTLADPLFVLAQRQEKTCQSTLNLNMAPQSMPACLSNRGAIPCGPRGNESKLALFPHLIGV
jgi:hypothetical protein